MRAPARPPKLAGSEGAAVAIAHVLDHQLALLHALEPAVRAQPDGDTLHDFRVAVRRTRSVLSSAKNDLPDDVLRWADEWAWLADLTSGARDLDIVLDDIDAARATLPAHTKTGLDEIAEVVTARRTATQRELQAALDSERYRVLVDGWRASLGALALTRGDDRADRIARRLAKKATKQVAKRASRIDARSSASSIHDLRKRIKRLRYVLELFRDVLPKATVTAIVKETKRLQDELGAFQDNEVRGRVVADAMATARTLSADAGVAGQLLLDRYEARRTQARTKLTTDVGRFAKNVAALT